jgi:large subunit ribosomal protein L24
MNKIKTGDQVIVTTGKDKGRTGKVLSLTKKNHKPDSGLWAVVEGIKMIKKHVKGNPQANKPGGIVSKEAALHVSNIALLNPATNKADKLGFKQLADGKKVRYFKSNDEVVDNV